MPKKFKLTKKQMYIGGAVVAAGLAYWYWQNRKAKMAQVAAATATPPNQYVAAANALLNLIPQGGVINQGTVQTPANYDAWKGINIPFTSKRV